MFNRFLSRFGWVIFLLLAGVFLLLSNLGVFGPYGELIWGGLFVLIGLGFIVWFFVDRGRWWRVIPGVTLLASGAVIALDSQKIALGNWAGAIVLFGIALSFWILLLKRGDFWWAAIPGGVLTVVSVLIGLRTQLSPALWTAALLVGLGLVFLLLYLVRFGQTDTRWASVPAGWLMLLGLVTAANAAVKSLKQLAFLEKWWPIVLVLAAVIILVLMIARRPTAAPKPVTEPAKDYDAPKPASGASVATALPPAPAIKPFTAEPAPKPSGSAPELDIYKLIEQQPKTPNDPA